LFASLFEEMVRRGTILDFTALVGERYGCPKQINVAIAQAAHEAGVIIATGTDFQTDISNPYPALYDEIEYLVGNGVMTPLEVITAATLNGAHAAGIADSHGTVEVGKVANLDVLQEDPSADISALRSIQRTIMHGEVFERSEYVSAQAESPSEIVAQTRLSTQPRPL
jgi:imidazolonepropionase-like amidohydrolase